MARRYLNRPGPVQEAGLGPFFWRRVFVPVYRRLPWELRRSVIQALPGSHRRRWQAQRPARRQPNVQQPIRTTSKGADSMPKTVDTPRGKEGFPGNLAINNQIKTLLKEGAHVYACRFAMGALYGFREDDLIDGVKAFNPLDVLDSALAAWRPGAFQLNTWTA